MDLEIRSLWSSDLNPPSEGTPEDVENYSVYVQLSIGERGQRGAEVFGLTVCSPSQLRAEDGQFVTHTLVMRAFSWKALRSRLEKLLRHVGAPRATRWAEVIERLKPYLHASDHPSPSD
jgi:hypothetical protein